MEECFNRRQVFELSADASSDSFTQMKIVFEESSDFFGRITLYDVQLNGYQVTEA